MPSLARSVPKPLKVPSLARSVPKPLKMPSIARSVPKPRVGEAGTGEAEGPQTCHYHRCRPSTSWLRRLKRNEKRHEKRNKTESPSCRRPKPQAGCEVKKEKKVTTKRFFDFP